MTNLRPASAEPAAPAGLSTASPPSAAQPRTSLAADHTTSVLVLATSVIYLGVAHALGLRLPDLDDPWRSILIATAAVGATFYAAASVVGRRDLPARQKANAYLLLTCTSLNGWAVLVILIVRDRGLHDALALLLAIVAGMGAMGAAVACFVSEYQRNNLEVGRWAREMGLIYAVHACRLQRVRAKPGGGASGGGS